LKHFVRNCVGFNEICIVYSVLKNTESEWRGIFRKLRELKTHAISQKYPSQPVLLLLNCSNHASLASNKALLHESKQKYTKVNKIKQKKTKKKKIKEKMKIAEALCEELC